MSGPNSIWVVPSEHFPALVALVVTPLFLWLAYCGLQALRARELSWAVTVGRRLDDLSGRAKVALMGVWVGFIVHVVIVPTHWRDAHGTALLFCLDAALFVGAGVWMFLARPHWKLVAVAVLAGTAGFYALYLLAGWETADPVGLITTTIELASALVLLVPVASAVRTSRVRDAWLVASAVPVALVTLLGVAGIAGTSTATASASDTTSKTAGMSGMKGMTGMTGTSTTAFSLPTTSPAGAISWPYNMGTMAAGMKMVDPTCNSDPTSTQQKAAVTLVNQTVSDVAPFRSLAAAKAAGYVPLTPTGQRQVHYINPTIYREQSNDLDPNAIPVLVYDNTNRGAVLVAAMYLMPQSGGTPPQPGGCLTQWHVHTDLCLGQGVVVGNDNNGSCPAGSANRVTPPMIHVWVVPDGSGPLDPEPSNLSVFQGARTMVPNPANAVA